jgi:hypothetical protein
MLNGNNQAMRETWLPLLSAHPNVDYRFFVGLNQTETQEDTVRLRVCDDYKSLPLKTRESARWAIDRGYSHLYRCFTDTCVQPSRLLDAFREDRDYCGHFPGGYGPGPDARGHYCYASGGPGYWLSRRACEEVVKAEPDHWAEDLWLGDVMGRAGIEGVHDDRYFFKWSRPKSDTISVHLSRGTNVYDKSWMHDCWQELRLNA